METFLQSPLPETITELEDQIALIEKAQAQCVRTIRDLMEREDPLHGVAFPAEIHELHQQKKYAGNTQGIPQSPHPATAFSGKRRLTPPSDDDCDCRRTRPTSTHPYHAARKTRV